MNNPYLRNYDVMADRAIEHYYDFVHRNVSGLTSNTQCYFNITKSLERFSPYDVIQVRHTTDDEGNQIINLEFIELKGRHIPYEQYSDCSVSLDKIQELQKVGRESGKDVWLVALYYLSDKVAMWKIDPNRNYEMDAVERRTYKYTAQKEEGKAIRKVVPMLFCCGYTYDYVFPEETKEMVLNNPYDN